MASPPFIRYEVRLNRAAVGPCMYWSFSNTENYESSTPASPVQPYMFASPHRDDAVIIY